ncbi:IclR family transcriptional regulator [Nonomuraea sp. NPDC050547]|uniref:IclR family transcriptional regulator n=1 Tax=unclassified Nonomuraea TaxID=2593643 RepID=UPI00379FFC87
MQVVKREATYPIRAVDRVCDVLDLLQESPEGVSLTLVAERTGLPKSSAMRYLMALEARRYAERDPADGTYRLGIAFRFDRTRYLELVRNAAEPYLVKLRDRFHETVNLGMLYGAEIVYVAVVESERSVRLSVDVGARAPIHSTAIGKAIATQLDEHRLREILGQAGMPAMTDDTITDPDAYVAEAAKVAAEGYAVDDCEDQPDGRCVAVLLPEVPVPSALSVSAPASRFAVEDAARIAHHLRKAAQELAETIRALPA